MKQIHYLLVIVIMFFSVNLNAQETLLNFKEEAIVINGESINVANTTLKGEEKQIQKQWIAYVKNHIDKRMKEDDGIYIVKKIVIEELTNKRGDLLAYFYTKDNVVSLNVSFRLGYDIYLNSAEYESEFIGLNRFVNNFVYNYYNEYLPKIIKEKSKVLKQIVKEGKKAEKGIKKSTKSNISDREKISKSKIRIRAIDNDLISESDEVAKKKMISEKEDLIKYIKNLENSLILNNKLIKSNELIISNLDPRIEEATNEIKLVEQSLKEVKAVMKANK